MQKVYIFNKSPERVIYFFMFCYRIRHRQRYAGFIVSPNDYKTGTSYITAPVRSQRRVSYFILSWLPLSKNGMFFCPELFIFFQFKISCANIPDLYAIIRE